MPLAQAPLNSPFGNRSVAGDVIKGFDLNGKTPIVTRASSGLGVETVRALAGAGARVVMPVRSREKGEKAAADLRADDQNFAGVRPWAIDPAAARKLWSLSETLLGTTFAV